MALDEQLGALVYEGPSLDFVRFRDVGLDDDVRSLVLAAQALDEDEFDRFRQHLDDDANETLWTFATRRTLQARRRSSPNMLDDAFSAFALQSSLERSPWASWLKAALFVARSLGRDLEAIEHDFERRATPRALELFRIARSTLVRIDTIEQCRLVEVVTSYGVGFVEIMVLRDKTTFGALGNPGRPDEVVDFAPTINLAQLAVSFADALDATRQVATTPIVQDQLAAMSFSLNVRGSYVPTLGCLSFYCVSEDEDRSFKVFVAQVTADADTDALVEGAVGEGRLALARDELIILLEAPPRFDDLEGAPTILDDVAALARTALDSNIAAISRST